MTDGERHEEIYAAILDRRVTRDMLEHIEACAEGCRFAFHFASLVSPAEPAASAAEPLFDEVGEQIASGKRLLLGRYLVLEELGRGGQGRVYRAIDTMMADRRIALKLCSAPLEARLAQEVQHPNVCRVLGAQRHGDLYLIELELIEGPPLGDRMGTLKPDETRAIFAALCSGVAALHRAGVLHLDLNPRNILLRGGVDPVVTDLGFGASAGGRWRGGAPGYTAPEVENGATPTPRTDVYALGLLLRQMTVGRRMPASVRGVVSRATDPDPRRRYADASELGAAFNAPFRRRAVARRAIPLAGLAVLLSGSTLWWRQRCGHELGNEEIVDLSRVDIDDSADGIDAAPRLRAFGISVPENALYPPRGMPVRLRTERSLYDGKSTRATTSNVLITQVRDRRSDWQGPVSFALRFDAPVGGVKFSRPVLFAETESGVTHPRWSAHALDDDGREISECHEAMIQGETGCYMRACKEVPAVLCVLTAPACGEGIRSVRFDSDYRGSDGRPFAGFQALLIERLTLIPWRGRP